MHKLLVKTAGGSSTFLAADHASVRDVLDTTNLRVRAACGGTGTCGACTLTVVQGAVSPLTTAEYLKLSPEERAAGKRLACQLRMEGDVEVMLAHPAPPSVWKSIAPENLMHQTGSCAGVDSAVFGVAVDLGTTHIRVAVWDRKRGKRVATRWGANPQGEFGADVLNRLEAAHAHPEHAVALARLARLAVVDAVRDILARDVGEVSHMMREIGEVLIVGNTAMLSLLSGQGVEELMDPAYWEQSIDCQPPDLAQWPHVWHMPNARFLLPAPVAGFVGSDLLADLVATGLAESPPGALLIDVGTNTEIALWDGEQLHVTSVPGGPAFEGVGIRHGMPAEPGAIFAVAASAEESSSSGYWLSTLGGLPAKGFCGTGLLDAIAVLRAQGILKPSGRFANSPGPEGYRLDPDNPRSSITGVDVDAFQRAKAALAAAVAQLLRAAGMRWSDLTRLCLCGAFGHTLNVDNAQALGVLPQISRERVELLADASLAGAEKALLVTEGSDLFNRLLPRIKPVNLSLVPDYENEYIDHLRLRPIAAC